MITRFSPETDLQIGSIANFSELEKRCDALRTSGNIFYAFRLDGTFKRIRTRAVSPPEEGMRLVDAAKAQSEFRFTDVTGTLVGLWSPGFHVFCSSTTGNWDNMLALTEEPAEC